MTLAEFAEKVQKHDDLDILGATEDDEIVIRRDEVPLRAVPLESILLNEWQRLEAVLMGRENGRAMIHIARIVGYFSVVKNWNRSKLAELHDRHKGDYGVSEGQLAGLSTPVELPAEVVGALPIACEINEKPSP